MAEGKVAPAGRSIRRLRRARGLSRRELVRAIADAAERESGLRQTVSINELEGMEERNEAVAYETLRRVAAGLECDPASLLP